MVVVLNANLSNSNNSTSNSIKNRTSPSPISIVGLMVDATILVLVAEIQHRVIETNQPSRIKWE
eukprot:11577706-Ditylum_brightwellii.AAC.1